MTLWQDVRYGLRTLLARPGFTVVAIAVLALGIGANSAIFSLVNAFLFKPLVMRNPGEIAGCYSRNSKKPDDYRGFSYPNYADLRGANPVFSVLMAHSPALVGVAEGDTTRRVFADIVSANYFDVFGVPLFRGRGFTAAEEKPDSGQRVVIVSHNYWKKHGADPELIGKSVRINGNLFTIVGIAPEGFSGTTALVSSELYVPLGVYSLVQNDFDGKVRSLAQRNNNTLLVIGRLRPGLSLHDADAKLAVVAAQLERAYPGENKDQTFIARPLSRMTISNSPQSDSGLGVPAILLLSMSGVVLLIACLNLANMMLARGTARRKEIAVRLAIGGGRSRIVRQLLTEGLILALTGGAVGLLLAGWSTSLLVSSLGRLAPMDILYSAQPDIRVLAVTLGFCAFSTLAFGLGPAWNLSRADVVSDLRKAGADGGGGAMRRLFGRRNLLVMGQLALSLMMLTAAGTFVRSAMRAASIAPGFAIDHAILAEVDPSLAGYDETRGRQIYRGLLPRLRALPGIESASIASMTPFGMTSFGTDVRRAADGKDVKPVSATYNIVGDDYFRAMGIPLLRGREFSAADGSDDTRSIGHAVIDKLAAERLWPNGDGLGQHIILGVREPGKPADEFEVVGIAGDVQDHIIGRSKPDPHVYVPFGRKYQADMQIHLRMATRNAAAETQLLQAVRREIRAVDGSLPVLAFGTMRDHLDRSFDLWIVRTGARMLVTFGLVALVLAVIGLYGVRAYTVAQRTREIGIRMALGADTRDALKLILREGLAVTIFGIAGGMLLALGIGQVLAGLLYAVSAVDPVVFLGAPAILTVVSVGACLLPAWRASHVDPMAALRYE